MTKRLLVLAALLALLLPTDILSADGLNLTARSAILMDMTTGRILYAHNSEAPIQPASITKILTLYVADEAIEAGKVHLRDTVKISRKAGHTGGSKMYIQPGSEIPLEQLLTGVAVVSANDASVAVAEHIAGDVDEFVERMNLKAQELGMTKSVFKNPNGLPAKGQVTTARDMLTLAYEYLRRFPKSLQIHSQQFFTYRHITQHNRNTLLAHYPNADGLKTGWVSAAGYHLIATAKRGETRLIAVVMGAKNPRIRAKETERLLDEGFRMVLPQRANPDSCQSGCEKAS